VFHPVQNRAEFFGWIFVILIDGKLESLFEQRASASRFAGGEEDLSEHNAGHHPIGFLGHAELEVRDRFGFAVGVD